MTSRTLCSAIVLLSAIQSCARRPYYEPHWEDQTALHDVDAASLVVLGRVYATRTHPPANTVQGLRPAYADIHVLRVLKGSVTADRICVVHLLPSEGYCGPVLRIPVPGTFGVFTLYDGRPCYRVVSDRQAVIPATEWPPDKLTGKDVHEVVAAITLPQLDRRCTRGGIQEIANDLSRITSSLVGLRRALSMLRERALEEGTTAEQCQCVVSAMVSLTVPTCMDTTIVPRPPYFASVMEKVKRENTSSVKEARIRFLRNPLQWLRFTVENSGLDETVLALGSLQDRTDSRIPAESCQQIGNWLDGEESNRLIASAHHRRNRSAETSAREDLRRWVKAGCTPGYAAQHFRQ